MQNVISPRQRKRGYEHKRYRRNHAVRHRSNENYKKIFVYFGFYPENAPDKRNARRRRSYREYSSTMSCSFTIGCISSLDGMRATLPLSASRSTVSQSGTGTIWVRSRFRSTGWRNLGWFLFLFSWLASTF